MKKNVFITILVILVLCLGGYLVYDKVIESGDVKEETNNNEESDVDVALARLFIDNIIDSGAYNILEKLSESGLTEEIKILMSINNIEPGANDCSNAFEMNTCYGNNECEYRTSDERWSCAGYTSMYVYDFVNEEYKKLFGKISNVSKISTDVWKYEYSSKLNAWMELSPNFGPIISNEYYYVIQSSNIIENELVIEISYISYDPRIFDDGEEFEFSLNNKIYKISNENDFDKVYSENKESLPRLKFIYVKEDGSYILKSVN